MQQQILSYWFGDVVDQPELMQQKLAFWYGKNDDVDNDIRQQFGEHVERASQGDYDDWQKTAEGRLALIILLDQFTRNIYRNTSEVYAADAKALQIAMQGIELGHDQQLQPIHRVFMYMPLEHAEDKLIQQRCVELFEQLANSVPDSQHKLYLNFLDYAIKHQEVVDRFGRFPHRNKLLNRQSTQQEQEFLQQPGSSF